MGLADDPKRTAQIVKGKIKEAAGRVTDDRDVEAEGRADQATGDLAQAKEHVKAEHGEGALD